MEICKKKLEPTSPESIVELEQGIIFFYVFERNKEKLALASRSQQDLKKWHALRTETQGQILSLVENEFTRPFYNTPTECPGIGNPKWLFELSSFTLNPLTINGGTDIGRWWDSHKGAEEYLPRQGYRIVRL